MRYPNARILVFAKAPRPGEVKTRLIPRLGADGAAELHAALVHHTLRTATARALCPVELWCTPATDDPFFVNCAHDFPVTLHAQHGADLGARMHHAMDATLRNAERAVLIGADCPALTPERLEQALLMLDECLDECIDAVITPAVDGGYVLIGLRRTEPALFDAVPWGGPDVMRATRACLQRLVWRWRETGALPDIDEPDDLQYLPEPLRSKIKEK